VHSSTQQMPFFASHGLHPKFDIQGVHKVVNPITKDRTMCFVDVRVQLLFNFEKTQRQYKDNVDEHKKNNPVSRLGTRFGFDNNISKQQGH